MAASNQNSVATRPPVLLVLGATGGTGRLLVSQALARGVRALVRSPDRAGLAGADIVAGDARDEAAVRQALRGATLSSVPLARRSARSVP